MSAVARVCPTLKPERSRDRSRRWAVFARSIISALGLALVLCGCIEAAPERASANVGDAPPPTANIKPTEPPLSDFLIDSTCIGRLVTQKCAVDTYFSCIASGRQELCDAVGIRRDSIPKAPPGLKLKSVSYLVDDIRWQGGVMGWDSGVYDVRKRWPIRETYCAEADETCMPSHVRYTFLTLTPDWRAGLWKIAGRTPGYPMARYPWPETRKIHDLASDSLCMGDMSNPLCAAVTVLACREQGVCRDMATGKTVLAPYSYRPNRYLEYRIWDVYEDLAQATAPTWNVVIAFRSCPQSANLNDRSCVGSSSWSVHLFKMIRQQDGIWAADRIALTR